MNNEELIDHLGVIAWYNGHAEEIKQVIDYIRDCEDEYSIRMPYFLQANDFYYYMNVLWQICVLQWGEYGTSPRYGWLEIKNKKEILEFWESLYEEAKGDGYETYND